MQTTRPATMPGRPPTHPLATDASLSAPRRPVDADGRVVTPAAIPFGVRARP